MGAERKLKARSDIAGELTVISTSDAEARSAAATWSASAKLCRCVL